MAGYARYAEMNCLPRKTRKMLLNPRVGSTVQVWYRADMRWMPFHARTAVVRIASHGKPRNHGVEIDGRLVVVPCGNLRKWED
jgi:hypothetical protein